MAKSKDLRTQTAVVATPGAGVVSLYADSSGVLQTVNSAGTIFPVGAIYTITNANGVVTLTSGTFRDAGGQLSSGYFYGTTGTRIINTALGEPNIWISVNVSGATYSIPAYTRT